MTKVIFTQSILGWPSKIAAHKQANPQLKKVAENNHFLPVFIIIYMAIAIAGISTKPAKACQKETVYDLILIQIVKMSLRWIKVCMQIISRSFNNIVLCGKNKHIFPRFTSCLFANWFNRHIKERNKVLSSYMNTDLFAFNSIYRILAIKMYSHNLQGIEKSYIIMLLNKLYPIHLIPHGPKLKSNLK